MNGSNQSRELIDTQAGNVIYAVSILCRRRELESVIREDDAAERATSHHFALIVLAPTPEDAEADAGEVAREKFPADEWQLSVIATTYELDMHATIQESGNTATVNFTRVARDDAPALVSALRM